MKVRIARHAEESGSVIAFMILAMIIISSVAAVSGYVAQNANVNRRRVLLVDASNYAESGALIAARDLENAYTNSGVLASNLAGLSSPYTYNNLLSTAYSNAYERVITSPFTNQAVAARIWLTNAPTPTKGLIESVATVGGVSATNYATVEMTFGWAAAIISDSPGTSTTTADKAAGQAGNVSLATTGTETTTVDGGILANGRVNRTTGVNVDTNSLSQTNYGTANQVPDYTAEGSPDQLFDFNRFIAVADATPGGTNHYTSFSAFSNACRSGFALEGIVVVDIAKTSVTTTNKGKVTTKTSIPKIDVAGFPNGINVRGTLLFNFIGFAATDKLVNEATVNINAANLSGFNATNPATFTSGYPPVYSNPAKNPANVTPVGYPAFTAADDLPAMMYNIGVFDIHGNANICGVVYSPSYMEIENKVPGNTQYFKGSIIGGGGMWLENIKGGAGKQVFSFDPNALDRLATSGSKGKTVKVTYRQ